MDKIVIIQMKAVKVLRLTPTARYLRVHATLRVSLSVLQRAQDPRISYNLLSEAHPEGTGPMSHAQ